MPFMPIACRFIPLVFFIFISLFHPPQSIACVESLSWGMDLSNVEKHLGVSLLPVKRELNNEGLFEVSNVQLSGLPVQRLSVLFEKENGLKQLAYEMDYEYMTEVLAALRYRYGSPVSTNVESQGGSSQQQWIWHTGEDIITGIKSDKKPFLLSYRPSRLELDFL